VGATITGVQFELQHVAGIVVPHSGLLQIGVQLALYFSIYSHSIVHHERILLIIITIFHQGVSHDGEFVGHERDANAIHHIIKKKTS
jgi:hypothetical protein